MKFFALAVAAGSPGSNIASQTHVPQTTISITPTSPTTFANPIFPKSTSWIRNDFTEVEARRDPRDTNKLLYKIKAGWVSMGGIKLCEAEDKRIIYSEEKRIWVSAEKVQR